MTDTPDTVPPLARNEDTARGLAFALFAYLFWGVLPLYLKLVSHIPAAEVVAHRVIWSVPLAGGLLIALGRTADLRAVLRDPRALAMGAVTAALISVNWGVYVWAVASNQAVEAALGYYINPLFSIALGYMTWAMAQGQGNFTASWRDAGLLIGCGVVTAVPLIAYANGAKGLKLSTIGILQYIAPTGIFLVAVFVFDEPFGRGRMTAFPMIWLALVLYSTSMLRQLRAARAALRSS
ncbi:MAG TPA: EamA family transporter RarD [Rhodobacteraceae bacterium]|nr:EamA family transporter RarD [Paracoccaceae bacterium]